MSMHLRGSRDMMGKDESWWQQRTGLEQKLVILATVLFILSFSLMISVIVIKNRSPAAPPAVSTVTPVTEPSSATGSVTPATGSVTPATGSVTPATGSVTPATSSVTPETSSVTPATSSVTPATSSVTPATSSVTPAPSESPSTSESPATSNSPATSDDKPTTADSSETTAIAEPPKKSPRNQGPSLIELLNKNRQKPLPIEMGL